ncbi:MAG: carboxylate-amine ligase [Pseudolabrys sp.]|nr:carboxylate-amine ligase [Pseudolabrys sp.]
MYSIGLEEEYFVFDARSRRAITRADRAFLTSIKKRLGGNVMTEMLQSQVEAVTPVCATLDEARTHLTGYRTALAEEAAARKLGIAAMGTFPLAVWPEQTVTPGDRYKGIVSDLGIIGLRNMLCGLHVHVGLPDPSIRVDLMKRVMPYLPLLLALSTSSPFWQTHRTGLHGYRLAAYDELPRTGLPELFHEQADYDEFVAALTRADIIPDASYIWWAIRPSMRYPTLELRIADSCTRLEDALAVAALFRCLVRALDNDRALNSGFDRVGRAITVENKWHAQRYGIHAVFVDPFRRVSVTAREWLDEILDFIDEDIAALGCQREIARAGAILRDGTSADEQIRIYQAARAAGRQRASALKDVVDWAAAETVACAGPGRAAA